MAKDVVRMRSQVTKFYKMRAQMQSASMQMQVITIPLYINCIANQVATVNGKGYGGGDSQSASYEPSDEHACHAEADDGVRKAKRNDGIQAGDDG